MRSFALSLAFMCLALTATAQTVTSDLNGDGLAERFTLIAHDGQADLRIETTGHEPIIAHRIAWSGGIGQKPTLALAPNGSVLLTSMNEAIGRNRWHLTLTIAFRQNGYRVVGYTYDWHDTLNLEDSGLCDLNLLTGKGTLRKGEGGSMPIHTNMRAILVSDFRDDHKIPEACGLD